MTSATGSDGEVVVGAFVLMRHGDKQGFYEDAASYTATDVVLTPLGQVQAYDLGALIQQKYMLQSSTLSISGINVDTFNSGQSLIKADIGGEGTIIFDSAVAATQGIWPPIATSTEYTLADGAVVSSPLNGYQYVEVQGSNPTVDLFFEGWLDCNKLTVADVLMYDSPGFFNTETANSQFLLDLEQYTEGRPTYFPDMYDVYDYMNTNYIHNSTFMSIVPTTVMAQVRALANYNQWSLFSSPSMGAIENVGGQTMLNEIMTVTDRFADPSDTLKFALYSASYKPFLSLFHMLNVTQYHPELEGIVNYAGALSLEIRTFNDAANTGDYYIRFNFKNGTDDADFTPYPMLGRTDGDFDVPFAEFMERLAPYAISDTATWCGVCNNTIDRGCDQVALIATLQDDILGMAANEVADHRRVSPVLAGVIGALVALAVAFILVMGLLLIGYLGWSGRKKGEDSVSRRGSLSDAMKKRANSMNGIVVRAVTKAGKRDSEDSESIRGIIKNPGVYEMMDDISVLHHVPARAIDDNHAQLKV